MDANAIADVLRRAVPNAQIEPLTSIDMPAIRVDRDSWAEVARTLRDDATLQFQLLSDVIGTDHHPRAPRYEIVYLLVSIDEPALGANRTPKRLRVNVPVPGTDARIPTVTNVWPGAGWPEREVFDMFGVTFEGHGDMRRVLMPEDWEGHPLRKDYPVQIRRSVKVYEPLQLSPEEFAANIDRIRRVSQEVGNAGLGREEEGEVGQRYPEPPTRATDDKYERKP